MKKGRALSGDVEMKTLGRGRKEPTVHVSRKISSEQKGRGGGREVMPQRKVGVMLQ